MALLADYLTCHCLEDACSLRNLTPLNYRWVLRFWKSDLLFVESEWNGCRNAWKFKVAAYPSHPERNNCSLERMVTYARELGIPCVFWNMEDGVHFDRFIDSARLFDHIFTANENCIPRYRAVVGEDATVNTLMFLVQTTTHNYDFGTSN